MRTTREVVMQELERVGYSPAMAQKMLEQWVEWAKNGRLTLARYGARRKGVGFTGGPAWLMVSPAEPGKGFPDDDHELLAMMAFGFNLVPILIANGDPVVAQTQDTSLQCSECGAPVGEHDPPGFGCASGRRIREQQAKLEKLGGGR